MTSSTTLEVSLRMSDVVDDFILEHSNIPMDHVDDFVAHYTQGYDPAKAHEYYLRTRKLKGKKTGTAVAPKGRPVGKQLTTHSVAAPKQKTALEHRKEVAARVESMKGRLEKLRKLLRQLVKEAQIRSGVDPKDQKAKAKATAGSEKLTAAEKKEAAKRSKEYREKHKAELAKETLTAQEKRLSEQIKDVEAKITKAKAELKAAVAKARQNSVSKNPAAQSRRNS